MSSPYQCDYLDTKTLPLDFTSAQAELAHVDEKIHSPDQLMSQLSSSPHALVCSRQLHNTLLPVQTLPFEILSRIFRQVIDTNHYDYPDFKRYHKCLCQALVLSSVSSCFRNVAFGTPELWRRVPLRASKREAINRGSSLLQHCMALAPSVDLSVIEPPDVQDEDEVRAAFDVLLTPDTTRKTESFQIVTAGSPPSIWIDKFIAFGSPMLNTLSIYFVFQALPFNIQKLATVTRLSAQTPWFPSSINVSPSIQYLDIECTAEEELVSLLYQCPELVECYISMHYEIENFFEVDTPFPEPLDLPHLKRLGSPGLMSRLFMQNLRLPSLEFLHLTPLPDDKFTEALILCRNVSSTLTTLELHVVSLELEEHDLLFQLCRIPFPKLRSLVIDTYYSIPHLTRVLELLEKEIINDKPRCFPLLESLIWHDSTRAEAKPCDLLNSLKATKVGEAFHFHFEVTGSDPQWWSPGLLDELKSVIAGRQIEIMWGEGEDKIHEVGVQRDG